jgi:hypothetical protein
MQPLPPRRPGDAGVSRSPLPEWNATLLSDVETVVKWAGTMTWKGIAPLVSLSQEVYQKGVRTSKAVMRDVERFITRNPLLPNWDLLIDPSDWA